MTSSRRRSVRVGCGSAYADDRLDLALDMTDRGNIQYLCMDSLAELTMSAAYQRPNPLTGGPAFDTRLPSIAEDLLPLAVKRGVTVVGSMGQANPAGAGTFIAEAARRKGLTGVRVGVIEGDNVTDYVHQHDPTLLETGKRVSELRGPVIIANAYIGADAIVEALSGGATFIVGGRLADPSLYVAPIAYALGWRLDDWERIGAATAVGHLLECGTYVSGGNFADPPYNVVERFNKLSFPLAEVFDDGTAMVSKLPDTDGLLSVATCKMQLGYEVHDPANYLTPDITADFRSTTLSEAHGAVAVAGAHGRQRPPQLKALVTVHEGFIGEGQVSFAGPGALSRARLAEEIVRGWLRPHVESGEISELKADLLGIDSLHGSASEPHGEPYEVHLRVAGRCSERQTAQIVADLGWYLQVSGPAGTGGHRKTVQPVIALYTFFLPRDAVKTSVTMIDA